MHRVCLRLVTDGAASVREAAEALAEVGWEPGHPEPHPGGGWSAVFYDEEPDWPSWLARLAESGYRAAV